MSEEDHPAARDRLAALSFETLTTLDAQGRLRPALALSWHADQSKRRSWQFRLRLANFHDGTVLTAADVAASLLRSNPAWRYGAPDRQTVTVDAPSPVQHMPEMLALPKYSIVKRQGENGAVLLVGTGPYKLTQWQAGERAQFSANENYWNGRSFPDVMEFQMGASLREQLLDRQLGPHAAAEVSLDQVRVLEQANQSVSLSRPAELFAVVFLQGDSLRARGASPWIHACASFGAGPQSHRHQQRPVAAAGHARFRTAAAMAHRV